MKILLLTNHLNYGGIAAYTVSLARQLKKKGDFPLTASGGGDFLPLLEHEQITHVYASLNAKSELSLKVLAAVFKLASLVKGEKVDIIHAQTRTTQVAACLISKMTNIPFVSTCHGFFKNRIGRRIFPCWGSAVIAISEAVREHLVNDFSVAKKDIRLIHNGVEVEKFKREKSLQEIKNFKENAGVKESEIVVGIIARLSKVKGHCFLLMAAKEIVKLNYKVKFLIIGDGPEKENLVLSAQELGIENQVVFLNSTIDTSLPLKAMDIFIMPSISEGLGLSILEAMSSGLPVVASNVGGIYSLVKDGVNGFLVPPGSPCAILSAVKKLLDNPQLARQMGQRGQQTAEECFSLESMAEQTRNLYAEVLDEFFKKNF